MIFLYLKRFIFLRNLVILIAVIANVGCASKEKQAQEEVARSKGYNAEILNKFRDGQVLLDEKQYAKARTLFKSILVKTPSSKFDLVVHFNLGAAYEGMGRCKLAAKRFRKTSRYAIKKYPRIEALSLLRLSYAYECLGKASKAAVTLVDVYNRRKFLPKEIAVAEVPARLAGAYAQLGNKELAKKYFAQAERGLGFLRSSKTSALARRELLAKTLYLMGKVKRSSLEKVGALQFMESLSYLQKYLLKSVEMGSKEWSHRSSAHLVEIYKDIWDQMQNRPLAGEKGKGKKRARVDQQIKIAQMAYFSLLQLKESRFPGDIDEPNVVDFFRSIGVQENRFQMFVASHVVGNNLTPEAQRLQGLKREGRGVGRPTKLERKRKKERKLPEKQKKDPNL